MRLSCSTSVASHSVVRMRSGARAAIRSTSAGPLPTNSIALLAKSVPVSVSAERMNGSPSGASRPWLPTGVTPSSSSGTVSVWSCRVTIRSGEVGICTGTPLSSMKARASASLSERRSCEKRGQAEQDQGAESGRRAERGSTRRIGPAFGAWRQHDAGRSYTAPTALARASAESGQTFAEGPS